VTNAVENASELATSPGIPKMAEKHVSTSLRRRQADVLASATRNCTALGAIGMTGLDAPLHAGLVGSGLVADI